MRFAAGLVLLAMLGMSPPARRARGRPGIDVRRCVVDDGAVYAVESSGHERLVRISRENGRVDTLTDKVSLV
jgi:hypothetical protein